jgi:hypothetical protein
VTEPLSLDGAAAGRWAAQIGRALDALRLNRQFPDWERVRDHLATAAATTPELRLDRGSALPVPREWLRVRVEAELRQRPSALAARDVHVSLRHVDGDRASYAVRVDRLDLATATFARYSLVLSGRPRAIVLPGEPRATDTFRRQLELLSTQDAGLAFAVLVAEGLAVEDVVRGVIGPGAIVPGDPLLPPGVPGCGPAVLRERPLSAPLLSACLERASLDLSDGYLDDPLAESVVIPSAHQPFGVSRGRKWAVAEADLVPFRNWVYSLGSRGLVYGYAP